MFLFPLSLLLQGVLCDLPATFQVNSYDLQLRVSSDLNSPVDGDVAVTLTSLISTSSIVMHWGSSLIPSHPGTNNLTILYTEPPSSTAPQPQPTPVTGFTTLVNTTTNQLKIITGTTFAVSGKVTVSAKYQTKLNQDTKGLFYRQYRIENSQIKNVLLTNLGPTFAREVFPCLDEPSYEADITLSLTYPSSWVVGATSSVSSSAAGTINGTTTTVFNKIKTPPSNIAFFLGESMRQMTYSVSRSTTSLSFWSRTGLPSSSTSANVQLLADYYYAVEDVLGFPLALERGSAAQLTIVMIPGLEEPISGYGIIFIREDNYTQIYPSPQTEGLFKATVAPVIYQYLRQFTEFSVRPFQWCDYWMSQAIAKYLEYVVLNQAMPLLDFKSDLEVVARQTALSLDSLPTTKPLRDLSVNTDSTTSVQLLVTDPLKSLKGAAILNMLDQSLPAGTVFVTIQQFLKSYMATSTSSPTFVTQIQKISDNLVISSDAKLALKETLGYWFDSNKYPLEILKIDKYTSQDSTGSVNFTTVAFCSAFNPECTSDLPENFYVSTTVGSKTDNRYYFPRQDLWVSNTAPNATVRVSLDVQDNDWVVSNMKSSGYYRTNYEDSNWERIIQALASSDASLVGHSQLMDDAFALSSSSAPLSWNITLRLALAMLGRSPLYRDWVPVQRGLQGIKNSLMGLDIYSSYKSFAAGYFSGLYGFLQNSSIDTYERARLQALFLDDMCENNIGGYRGYAVRNLTSLIQGVLPNMVPSSAYDAIACCGAAYSSNLKAQSLWNILSDSTRDYYSRRFASIALGCLSNYIDVSQLLESTMTLANLQLKHYMQITLENVANKNPVEFLANFSQLAIKFQYQLGAASVVSLVTRAARKINNLNDAAVLTNLASNADVDPEVSLAAVNALSDIRSRVNWLAGYNQTLVSALQSLAPGGSTGGSGAVAMTSVLLFLPSLMLMLAI